MMLYSRQVLHSSPLLHRICVKCLFEYPYYGGDRSVVYNDIMLFLFVISIVMMIQTTLWRFPHFSPVQ